MKPILFSTPTVRAIIDGRKTMTRRVVAWKPYHDGEKINFNFSGMSLGNYCTGVPSSGYVLYSRDGRGSWNQRTKPIQPPYKVGDILWVRETWFCDECDPNCAGRNDENECPFNRVGDMCYGYKAQYENPNNIKWHPSIYMPKEAARIFLKVTDVRVERLRDMSLYDVWSEGTPQMPGNTDEDGAVNQEDFKYLWDAINAKRGYGWDMNPFCWVISFERCEKPEEER
jgi:hypothetical protein